MVRARTARREHGMSTARYSLRRRPRTAESWPRACAKGMMELTIGLTKTDSGSLKAAVTSAGFKALCRRTVFGWVAGTEGRRFPHNITGTMLKEALDAWVR